jgi:hypothetical protein
MQASLHRYSRFILLGILACHGSLVAATIRFLPWDHKVAARQIAFQHGEEVEKLTLHPDQRSGPINSTVGEKLLQLVALDRTSQDGKPTSFAIKIPAGIQAPLVLILPDAKHPTGLRSFVIEDASANFAWGTMRFVNATGKTLLVRHDKTIKELPDTWTPVDIAPGGDARNAGVQVAAHDDTKTILYSAVWKHDPNIRKLIFVVPGADVRTGVVAFKIVPEDRRVLAATTDQETDAEN